MLPIHKKMIFADQHSTHTRKEIPERELIYHKTRLHHFYALFRQQSQHTYEPEQPEQKKKVNTRRAKKREFSCVVFGVRAIMRTFSMHVNRSELKSQTFSSSRKYQAHTTMIWYLSLVVLAFLRTLRVRTNGRTKRTR